MTAPTQAQIETAEKLAVKIVTLVANRVDREGELGAYDGIEAAREVRDLIITTAQVGEPNRLQAVEAAYVHASDEIERLNDKVSATIERCAQVVKEISQQEWDLTARAALEQAYIAIRKLAEPQLEPQSSMYQKRPDFVFPEEEP